MDDGNKGTDTQHTPKNIKKNISRCMNTNIAYNSLNQNMQPEHNNMGTNTFNNATSQDCHCGDQEMQQPLAHNQILQYNFNKVRQLILTCT